MVRDGRATVNSIITRKVTITGFDFSSWRQCMSKWNHAIETMHNQCKEIGSDKCMMVSGCGCRGSKVVKYRMSSWSSITAQAMSTHIIRMFMLNINTHTHTRVGSDANQCNGYLINAPQRTTSAMATARVMVSKVASHSICKLCVGVVVFGSFVQTLHTHTAHIC